ncbi:neuropeptide FF receptor 2-like [Erpetoichthys calabaricus]|uniref:neuropeptide FF receptor 2-like n=1 Tax=Erpetoichthys calabaricus TaxID=27687 RepID=UPI002234DC67|nr:neuropeptide FF receptor 2-like [Erpetoichthys calabaricus]
MWNFTAFPEWNRNKNATFSQYYQHSLAVAASYILSYLFIFILCMIGNGLVCLIVLKNKRMRTVTNLFILNLAISDLLVGIFCVPTTLVDNLITAGWPFSNAVCKMSGLVQGMSVSASVFTLVAIAVDRFRCIVYPFKPKLTLPEAVITIVIIWVLAVAIMCPSAVMLMVSQMEDHYIIYDSDYNQTFPMYSCYEDWPDTEMRKIYTTVLFAHIYLAPLTLITLMYSRIGVKLYSSSMPVSEHTAVNSNHPEGRNVVSRKKIKIIKMLIVVALLFMVSWLPLWTLMLLTDYANLSTDQLNLMTSYIFPFAHWLAFSNSSINPIIYGYFNENFKRGFQAAFKFQCCYEEMDHQETYGEKNRVSTGNVGSFGVRNKVYTDGDSSNSTIQKKDKRNISGDRAVLTNRHGLNIEDIDHIEPLATGVCQAWEV